MVIYVIPTSYFHKGRGESMAPEAIKVPPYRIPPYPSANMSKVALTAVFLGKRIKSL